MIEGREGGEEPQLDSLVREQTLEIPDLGGFGEVCGQLNRNCWLSAHFQCGFAFIPCPHFLGSFFPRLFIEMFENVDFGFFFPSKWMNFFS